MSLWSRSARKSLIFPFAVFLCIDFIFILIHVLRKVDDNILPSFMQVLSSANFSISTDGGYAEMFQYVKEFGIAFMFLILFQLERKIMYFGWAFLFFFLLLDDSVQIHETGGAFIVQALHLPALLGVGPQAYGELLMEAIATLVLFPTIVIGYFKTDEDTRAIAHHLLVLFAMLVACGVVTDFFDMFVHIHQLRNLLVVVEDGGEMIAMTCIFTYVYRLLLAPQIVFVPRFQIPWLPQPSRSAAK